MFATVPKFTIQISDQPLHGEHPGIYNRPTVAEIACIIAGSDGVGPTHRSIVINSQDGNVHHIKSNHTAYDHLSYPLTNPHGDKGWTFDVLQRKLQPDGFFVIGTKPVSPCDFYSYRLQIRDPVFLADGVGPKMRPHLFLLYRVRSPGTLFIERSSENE